MLKIGRRLAVFGMLAMTMAMAGCGDDEPTTPTSIAGTYTLRTVNGAALPYTMWTEAEAGFQRQLVSGSVTLNENGTYSDVFSYRDTDNGQVTNDSETTSGTWTRTGSTIDFEETSGAPQASARLVNGALVFELAPNFVMRLTR